MLHAQNVQENPVENPAWAAGPPPDDLASSHATLAQCQVAIASLSQRLEAATTRELQMMVKWAKQANTIDALKHRLAALQREIDGLRRALQEADDRTACLHQILTTQTRAQEVGV
jgi:septal ring factor EnvC (AmiA/AmiB activator)